MEIIGLVVVAQDLAAEVANICQEIRVLEAVVEQVYCNMKIVVFCQQQVVEEHHFMVPEQGKLEEESHIQMDNPQELFSVAVAVEEHIGLEIAVLNGLLAVEDLHTEDLEHLQMEPEVDLEDMVAVAAVDVAIMDGEAQVDLEL